MNEEIPQFPRLARTIQKTTEFLLAEEIRYFPLEPINIIKKHGWKLKMYSKIAKKMGIDTQREFGGLVQDLGSEDAVVVYDKKRRAYAISYNDLQKPRMRINFTLMHEIGHIVLGHLVDFPSLKLNRGGVTSKEYAILEIEANCFARNALTPLVVAKHFIKLSGSYCLNIFGLTSAAWYTRKKHLDEDSLVCPENYQKLQESQFRGFISSKKCMKCGRSIMPLPKGSFCPFCGNRSIIWRNDTMKYEDVYELDEAGRPAECPVCKNEDLIGGDFCKICGSYFINRCSNEKDEYDNNPCGLPADGNARYCIHCGSRTTYFNKGFLDSWDGKKQSDTGFSQIADEDLPF